MQAINPGREFQPVGHGFSEPPPAQKVISGPGFDDAGIGDGFECDLHEENCAQKGHERQVRRQEKSVVKKTINANNLQMGKLAELWKEFIENQYETSNFETIEEFAEHIGVHPRTFYKWTQEDEPKPPRKSTIRTVLKALNHAPDSKISIFFLGRPVSIAGVAGRGWPLYKSQDSLPNEESSSRRPMFSRGMGREDSEYEDGYVSVPLREATGAMGGGSHETGKRIRHYLKFRSDWIQNINCVPERLSVVPVFGDSMSPTIEHDSIVLIDESRKYMIKGKIYYLRYDSKMFVKRIKDIQNGCVVIKGDGEDQETFITAHEDFAIIGQCIWTARTLL